MLYQQFLLTFLESEYKNRKKTTQERTLCKQMHFSSATDSSDAQQSSFSRCRTEDWTNYEPNHLWTHSAWTPFVTTYTEGAILYNQNTKPYEVFEIEIKLKCEGRIYLLMGFANIPTELLPFTQRSRDLTFFCYCCNGEHLAMCEFRLYNSLMSSSGCDYPRLCLSNANRSGIMYDVANRIHLRLDDETVYVFSPMVFDLLLYPNALLPILSRKRHAQRELFVIMVRNSSILTTLSDSKQFVVCVSAFAAIVV